MKNHYIAGLVVWFLGIIGIILAVGVVFLTWQGAQIDGGLFTMAGGAIGALGAILTNTNNRQQGQREGDKPEPVEVTATEPLPVEVATDSSAIDAKLLPPTGETFPE